MVQRHHLRCEVCGAVTIVRWQVGWLERHPVRVPCGGCGIVICGVARIDQEKGTAELDFENGRSVGEDEGEPRFYIEASGEFLTAKLRPYAAEDQFRPSPFINAFAAMGDGYLEFSHRTTRFLRLVKNDWPKLRRIMELWRKGQREFLAVELEKHAVVSDIGGSEGFHLLRSVHLSLLAFLDPIVDGTRFGPMSEFVIKEVSAILQTPAGQALAKHAIRTGLLERTEAKIAESVGAFVDAFLHLVPIFSLRFLQGRPTDVWTYSGVTTSSFEDVKELYIDCYEAAADALTLIVMLNNVKLRGRFRAMAAKRKDIVTLEDFAGKPKGARVVFVDGSEPFDGLVAGGMNTKLRNAIGHRSFTFDAASQVITYHPDGSSVGPPLQMPLGAFLDETWRMFETLVLNLGEVVYQVRKYEFASHAS
jgi:hypothetical protein